MNLVIVESPAKAKTINKYLGDNYTVLASLSVTIFDFLMFNGESYYFYIILFILIFYTHRENIKRLINNTETKTKIY